nr:meprin=metalloendopeptidase [mice, Peptide Partial, 6 aa] [Mus sp.]
VPQLAK